MSELFGLNQGSQDAPSIYGAIWSSLYSTLETVSAGLLLTSPDGSRKSERKAEGYVDDTDLWVNWSQSQDESLEYERSPEELMQGMTTLAQRWYDSIRVVGGALKWTKCSWCGMFWIFPNGKPKIAPASDFPQPLVIETPDEPTAQVAVKRVLPSKGVKALGNRIAMDGSMKDELLYKKGKVQEIKKKVLKAPFTRSEATIAHDKVWWPSVGYSLAVSTFDPKQCAELQSIFQQAFISKMGYNRCMPRAVRYGPLLLGGVTLWTVWTEQGLKHILLLLHHLRANDDIGQQLRISCEVTQLETGISTPFWADTWEDISGYVEDTWITNTWRFLSDLGLKWHDPELWIPKTQRRNDFFIMEKVNEIMEYSPAEKRAVQRCRYWLRVTLWSDILDGSGRYILEQAWEGDEMTDRRPTWKYPRQGVKPPATDWRLWRNFLKRFITNARGNYTSPIRSQYECGKWLEGVQRSQIWKFHYSPTMRQLYETFDEGTRWRVYDQIRRQTFSNNPTTTSTAPPTDASPVTVDTSLLRAKRMTGFKPVERTASPSPIPPGTTLHELVEDVPEWQRHYLRGIEESPEAMKAILDGIPKGDTFVCADGSAPKKGGFQWMITNRKTEHKITGGGFSGQVPWGLTSHRMEGSGCLGGLRALALLIQHFRPEWTTETLGKFPSLIFYSDNDECIGNVNRPAYKRKEALAKHDRDLYMFIDNEIRQHLPTILGVWIKGHQDKNKPYEDLPYEVQKNIDCDHGAESFCLHATGNYKLPTPPYPTLLYDNHPVTCDVTAFVRERGHYTDLQQHIMEKNEWTKEQFEDVDWQALGGSMKKLNPTKKTRIIKFMHNWLPTRKQMQDRDNTNDGRCSCCTSQFTIYEDEDHVNRCPNERITEARQKGMENLRTTLDKLKTPKQLTTVLLSAISQWQALSRLQRERHIRWPEEASTGPFSRDELEAAFDKQAELGWNQLLRGRIAKSWTRLMATFYRLNHPKDKYLNATRWSQQLVKALWDLFEGQWLARNAEIYGANEEEAQEKARKELEKEIKHVFTYGSFLVAPQDRQTLFRKPQEELLKKSTHYQRSWLGTYKIMKDRWQRINDGGDTDPHDPGP